MTKILSAKIETLVNQLEAVGLPFKVSSAKPTESGLFHGNNIRNDLAVAYPRNLAEVEKAYEIASNQNMPISCLAGGHHVSSSAIADKGLTLNFKNMTEVVRDENDDEGFRVQPGATWAQFDQFTSSFGKATTGGIVSDTGVYGLTLGGGFGWLMGISGVGCDAIYDAKVLLANGDHIRVNTEHHKDLLWALKGCGTEFGIITELYLKTLPVRNVTCGSIRLSCPLRSYEWETLIEILEKSPPHITVSPQFLFTNGLPQLSVDIVSTGPEDETYGLVSRLIEGCLSHSIKVRPYATWQGMLDNPKRRGLRTHWETGFVRDLSVDFLRTLEKAFIEAPSKHWLISLDHLHGQANDEHLRQTACYPHRSEKFCLLLNANWETPNGDLVNVERCKSLLTTANPFLTETKYCNYTSYIDESQMLKNYGKMDYERLKRTKQKYDPDRQFSRIQEL